MKLVECVPNFSEGRDAAVVDAIRAAIASAEGATILDVSSDPSHHRSVITFVAPVEHAVEAAFRGMKEAASRIDLTRHQGEHPRIGATDVVPFVPLEGATMDDCIALAHALGARAASELGIPVYLYERAASRPDRENLADVRRGEFEGLRDEIAANVRRAPDYGEPRIHPTAGATAIGARPFLVAYNVYLGGAENLQVARDVARAVRHSTGGLRHVKGLGLEVDGQAQVSMNLVDIEKTPLYRAFDMVKMEAQAQGVSPTWSEVVGLVPERALFDTAARHLQLRGFSADAVLERKVRAAVSGGESLSTFVASVAAPTPAPGGGSVAAIVAALAAALAQMVAGLTIGRKKYVAVEGEMKDVAREAAALGTELQALAPRDAAAYEVVMQSYRLPKETPEQVATRQSAIEAALLGAAHVPLETARTCASVARLAAIAATKGNTNAASDAGVAALLAEAACRGASYNVQINVASLTDSAEARGMLAELARIVEEAASHAKAAAEAVQRSIAASAG
ncbi:MAG: glutamate formimidoyltransferase [Gemmatimonadaceae bacterium]|nr:glutamate formimidoyltransferase [Gemmatimonadaceae bacterium]